jgi:hypothetical protein
VLLVLGVLALLPVYLSRDLSPAPAARRAAVPLRLPRSPSEAALAEAGAFWVRGAITASRSLEQLEEWDPAGLAGDEDRQRREMLAQSPDVQHAREEALQAQALARNEHEAYRAGCLLALLDCTLGRHQEELAQARRLIALAPHDGLALLWLRHAARCNHWKARADPSNGALVTMEPTDRRSTGHPIPLGIRVALPP